MSNRKCRILVIEDNDDIRESVKEALQADGFIVTSASHGREALDLIENSTERLDLILTDLSMPVMDGRQFLRARYSLSYLAIIPVIVMTAEPSVTELADVHSVIQKPVDFRTLRRLIQEAVGLKNLESISDL